jgi:uncharacterized protein (TIGR02246 family)
VSTASLERIAAEHDVRDLIISAWAAIDRKDWTTYANAFAEDGEFEILGQRRRGRADIVAGPARDLEKFDGLQHIISNIVVRIDGDAADGQWYCIAVHVPDGAHPEQHADVGLRYRFCARRSADGWRFAEVVITPVWASGMRFEIEDPPL